MEHDGRIETERPVEAGTIEGVERLEDSVMRAKLASMLIVMAVALAAGPAGAAVYNVTPSDNWFSLLHGDELQPGDQVVLGAGTYSSGSRLSIGHRGTADNPVVIRAAVGADVVLTRPDASQNVVNMEGAQHLIFRGIEVTGGSAGLRILEKDGYDARYITIEDCHIHHTGGNLITANHSGNTYEGLVFRFNEVNNGNGHGEGFYLGGNDSSARFHHGVIEGNYIHDLVDTGNGYFQGDGIEIKDGSHDNLVRHNVIENTNYPGILVYGKGTTLGAGPNIVEQNVLVNIDNHAIQAAADAKVRNNLIYNPYYEGVRSQAHQDAVPGNLTIAHNTIINSGGGSNTGIRVSSAPDAPVYIANNAIYTHGTAVRKGSDPEGWIFNYNNVKVTDLDANFVDADNLDLYPTATSAFLNAGSSLYLEEKDFNGTDRDGDTDVGAYLYDPAGNPGWDVEVGFKFFYEGDANLDGVVDGTDLGLMAGRWGKLDTWGHGDFNGDCVIDGTDLGLMAGNWGLGHIGAGAGSSLPEPASLALLGLGGTLALIRRRRA
jgi:hypothetical protein